jgi:hypothetical protein
LDVYCKVCGEPWDNDELHEVEGMTYLQASRKFRAEGCGAVFGTECSPRNDSVTHPNFGLTLEEAADVLYDLLGDDMDGATAMLEDFGFDRL